MNLREHEVNLIQRIRNVTFTDENYVAEYYTKLYEFLEETERFMAMCVEEEDRQDAEIYLQDCAYEKDVLSALSR